MDNVQETIPEVNTEKHEEPKEIPKEQSSVSMSDLASYEESFKTIEPGQYLRGKIVKIDKEGIFVDTGHKSEGVIPPHEIAQFGTTDTDTAFKIGDEMFVMVIRVTDDGEIILSKKRADLESAWLAIIKAFESKEVVTGTCIEQVKGGLIADIGLRGFVPASHVDVRPVRDLGEFVGEALRLKVLELDRSRRKVVLSRKLVLEEEREMSREATLKSLYEGEIRVGKVARITNFGAFVNLGGVDGLIHISELSWRRIRHPSEVVKVGDEVEVLVLKVDKKKERISLSLRQAKPDPWLSVNDKFLHGDIVEGKVSKLAKNYVFVELAEGIEGLIPLVELAEEKIIKPEELLKVNQPIKVKILEIKAEERRITLSLRQALADAERAEYREYISSRGKHFTIGDHLKSKMEAKSLQEILAPKPAAEQKPAAPIEKPAVAEQKPQVTAPAVAEQKPQVTAPAVAEQKPQVTAPAVAEQKPLITAPAVAEQKPQVTAPAVAEQKPQVTAPIVTEQKPLVTVAPATEGKEESKILPTQVESNQAINLEIEAAGESANVEASGTKPPKDADALDFEQMIKDALSGKLEEKNEK